MMVSMPSRAKAVLRHLATVAFTVAGTLHFLYPKTYLAIMPPYIPYPLAMVYLSGAAEIAGGLGLLIRRTRRPAAWGLALLLVAVFPANVHMALNHIPPTAPPALLWGRLLLQPLLIWWVLSAAHDGKREIAYERRRYES